MEFKLTYKMTPSYIGFMEFIAQSYENLLLFSTQDRKEGIVTMITDERNFLEVCAVLDDLRKKFEIIELKKEVIT